MKRDIGICDSCSRELEDEEEVVMILDHKHDIMMFQEKSIYCVDCTFPEE